MNHPPILTANLTRETNVTLIFEAPEPDDPSVPDEPDPEDEE